MKLITAQFKHPSHVHELQKNQIARILLSFRQGDKSRPITQSSVIPIEWSFSFDKELRLCVTFDKDLFALSSVQTYVGVFQSLLAACIAQPSQSLSTIPLCNPSAIMQICRWNQTDKVTPDASSMAELFRQIVTKYPQNVAVTNGANRLTLTYTELDHWSDALALWLVDQGFGGDEEIVIGVWQDRGIMMVVSYLACLKAGCAYMVCFLSSFSAAKLMCMLI